MFECRVPAEAKVPAPHSHDAFEETIYGLEGRSVWTIDGREVEIGPGDCVCIRRGAVHGFANRGTETTTFLAIATPGVFGPAYFHGGGRRHRRRGGRPARPRGDRRGDATPRSDPRAARVR